jgi:hypothetical protein
VELDNSFWPRRRVFGESSCWVMFVEAIAPFLALSRDILVEL